MRLAGLSALVLLNAGCIQHETVVRSSATTVPLQVAEDTDLTTFTNPIRLTSNLPIERRLSIWYRDGNGYFWRQEAHVQSGTPWWQRFPLDLVTDLAPVTFISSQEALIEVQQVNQLTKQSLDDLAQLYGYDYRPPATPQSGSKHSNDIP